MTAHSTGGLPYEAQAAFSVLALFAGDVDFVRPGCVGEATFPIVFAINISGMCVGWMIVSSALCGMRGSLSSAAVCRVAQCWWEWRCRWPVRCLSTTAGVWRAPPLPLLLLRAQSLWTAFRWRNVPAGIASPWYESWLLTVMVVVVPAVCSTVTTHP